MCNWFAVQIPPRKLVAAAALCVALCGVAAQAQVDVLTQHNNNSRTGTNLSETVLTPANVNKTQFGMLFKRVVDDQLYTQPLIVTGVEVNGGTHDVVYVTTVNNSVYAFDATDPKRLRPSGTSTSARRLTCIAPTSAASTSTARWVSSARR